MKYAPSGLFLAVAACLLAATGARADIAIFGPGGPAAPMREAAKAFEDETGIGVTVTTGPTSQWMDEAKMDADAYIDFKADDFSAKMTARGKEIAHLFVEALTH